jgi:hypothetical protein
MVELGVELGRLAAFWSDLDSGIRSLLYTEPVSLAVGCIWRSRGVLAWTPKRSVQRSSFGTLLSAFFFQRSSLAGYNGHNARGAFMTRRLLQNKLVYRSLTLVFVFLVTLSLSAQWAAPQEESGGVPAYNAGPPPKGTKLPPLLTKAELWGADAQNPYQTHAYELAAKIPNVLHQQPCYCYCDRMGHNSLHSCFEGTHGAQCSTCLKELYYSYQQHQKGKTAAQIRAGIINGDWRQIDLQAAATMN